MTTFKEAAVLCGPSNESEITLGEQVCLLATRPGQPALLAGCGSSWRRASRT